VAEPWLGRRAPGHADASGDEERAIYNADDGTGTYDYAELARTPQEDTEQAEEHAPRARHLAAPASDPGVRRGQKVHLKIDPSVPDGRYHPRFDGLTGEVAGKQGDAFKVEITDGGKEKTLIVAAAHMKAQQ